VSQSIATVTLVVRDYGEALAFFTGALGFDVVEDTPFGDGKRWVRVAPPGGSGTALLLARAASVEQERRIGDQTGGRVSFFLQTSRFRDDYERMRAAGVRFLEEPRHEPYGWVVVFEDLYGNRWDLVEEGGATTP